MELSSGKYVALFVLMLWALSSQAGTMVWTKSSGFSGIGTSCDSSSSSTTVSCVHAWYIANVTAPAGCSMVADGTSGVYVYSGTTTKTFGINIKSKQTGNRTSNGTPCTSTYTAVYRLTENCDESSGDEFSDNPASCTAEDCSDEEGVFFTKGVTTSSYSNYVCADAVGDDQCDYEAVGVHAVIGGKQYGKFVGTGNTCQSGMPSLGEPGGTPVAEQCASSSGVTVCVNNASQNCGTVNGNNVCLDAVPPGDCVFLADGGMVCSDAADAPPAPSTSDGTAEADPDLQFDGFSADNPGDTFNYYNSTTVAGSGTVTEGAPDGGAGDSSSGGEVDTGGQSTNDGGECDPLTGDCTGEGGSVTGGQNCATPPACTGDTLMCASILATWRTACVEEISQADFIEYAGGTEYEGTLDEILADSEASFTADMSDNIDTTGFLGSDRACVDDYEMDLGFFGVYSVAFSEWCGLLGFIGNLVLMSAGLIAVRIIAGAF